MSFYMTIYNNILKDFIITESSFINILYYDCPIYLHNYIVSYADAKHFQLCIQKPKIANVLMFKTRVSEVTNLY